MGEINDKLRDRVYSLAIRQLDSTLSEEEKREFESLLLTSSPARQAYVSFVEESAYLRWLCVEECAEELATPILPREFARADGQSLVRNWLAGFACIIAVALATTQFLGSTLR